jgi:hypothetical protein
MTVEPKAVKEPKEVKEPKALKAEKVEDFVKDEPMSVVAEKQETTPEFVLAGEVIDCAGISSVALTIKNTGGSGLVYQVLGSNQSELALTNKIKEFAPLAKGETANFQAENLSWKFVGVYVQSEEAAVPTTVKVLAYPHVSQAELKKISRK